MSSELEGRLVALQAENEDLRLRLSRVAAEGSGNAPKDAVDEYRSEIEALRRALGRSEARYRQIVESAVDYAIIAADLDGVITTWNSAAESVLGWSAEQVIGRPLATIFTPEDVAAGIHEQEMRLSLTEGKARDERWHLKADGARFFASGEMMPLLGEDDSPTGFLKILRDRTVEVLERKELHASRERLQIALDASAIVGTFDWDVQCDRLYADGRFASVFAIAPEAAAAGIPASAFKDGIHPEDRPAIEASLAGAIESGDIFAEEFRTIDADGAVRWIFARGRCFRDARGRAQRFPGAIVDITAEKERTRRQAALLKLGDDMLRDGTVDDYSARGLEILGETLDVTRVGYATMTADGRSAIIVNEWAHDGASRAGRTADLTPLGAPFLEALSAGMLVVEDVTSHPLTREAQGVWKDLSTRSFVMLSLADRRQLRLIFYVHCGRARKWSGEDVTFIREILNRSWAYTRRRRAELALVEADTRFRLAQAAADIGTFDYDLRTGTLLWDDRCRAMFGLSPDVPVTYEEAFLTALHPDDRERVEAVVAATLDPGSGGGYDVVYRTIGIEDGVLRHVHATGQTLVENGETVRFVGAVRDITEEREAEERQRLLTRELQHRVKNTLAMVSAIANQTLRRAEDIEEGLSAFSARIAALSKAHDILTQTSWTAAPIDAVVEQSLVIHQPDRAERLTWSGPRVMLSARQSLALSLALHELATNAAKYGALSQEAGQVTIAWSIAHEGEIRRLSLHWQERGGPVVTAPSRKGFGSRLIERSLASEFGGTVEVTYAPDGVVCSIVAPLGGPDEA